LINLKKPETMKTHTDLNKYKKQLNEAIGILEEENLQEKIDHLFDSFSSQKLALPECRLKLAKILDTQPFEFNHISSEDFTVRLGYKDISVYIKYEMIDGMIDYQITFG
jgi:hypothetical protein